MTKCTKCKKNLNLGKLVAEWDKEFGEMWIGSAMINIICPHCKEGVMMVDLCMYDETEEVESIIGKVKIPKLKKHAKH
jgi:hypothetical protein